MSDAEKQRDRELAGKVDALPREIEPRRDLWQGVVDGFEKSKRARSANVRIATVISLVVVTTAAAASWFVVPHPIGRDSANRVSLDSPPPPLVPAPSAAPTVLVPEESSYLTALSGLRVQLDSRQGKLPPANRKAVNVSLEALDTAIATTRASLAQHPDDADLRAELDAEYELEIQTINDVLEWTTRT